MPRKTGRKRPIKPKGKTKISFPPVEGRRTAGRLLLVVGLVTIFSVLFSSAPLAQGWWGLFFKAFGWGSPLALGGIILGGSLLAMKNFPFHFKGLWKETTGVIVMLLTFWGLLSLVSPQGGGVLGNLVVQLPLQGGTPLALILLLIVGAGASLLTFRISAARIFQWYREIQARLQSIVGKMIVPPIRALPPVTVEYPPLVETAPWPAAEEGKEGAISSITVTASPTEPVPEEEDAVTAKKEGKWNLPPMEILELPTPAEINDRENRRKAQIIEETLASFGVKVKVAEISPGPAVTQFGVEPGFDTKIQEIKDRHGRVVRTEEVPKIKVKVSRITALANDLALALSASSIRIQAPVPGRGVVGIEVPNMSLTLVSLRGVMESDEHQRLRAKSRLALALGRGIDGEAVAGDLAKMPHLLIAGATGSGKSVCLNSIISCLLMQATPDEMRLILIDPKRVELSSFRGIPHLWTPVVVEMEDTVRILRMVIREMEERFKKFAEAGARNIEGYNRNRPQEEPALPYLVVIVDELADLMMASPQEVEPSLCRLAQLARATGIHLVVATQRPSVDVITGLIKANFPARISFAVTSLVDSRTILDMSGAEKLLGRGDMLYMPPDAPKPTRIQGSYVSDEELRALVNFWKGHHQTNYVWDKSEITAWSDSQGSAEDPLWEMAKKLASEHKRVSASLLQRRLRIGYPRAARLMDLLESEGIVDSSEEGYGRQVRVKSEEDTAL